MLPEYREIPKNKTNFKNFVPFFGIFFHNFIPVSSVSAYITVICPQYIKKKTKNGTDTKMTGTGITAHMGEIFVSKKKRD